MPSLIKKVCSRNDSCRLSLGTGSVAVIAARIALSTTQSAS
jgi:hypothetical protein